MDNKKYDLSFIVEAVIEVLGFVICAGFILIFSFKTKNYLQLIKEFDLALTLDVFIIGIVISISMWLIDCKKGYRHLIKDGIYNEKISYNQKTNKIINLIRFLAFIVVNVIFISVAVYTINIKNGRPSLNMLNLAIISDLFYMLIVLFQYFNIEFKDEKEKININKSNDE